MKKAWLASLLAVGCLTASPEAERIRVTSSADVVRGCKFLGNVSASSGWDIQGIAANNADVTMREKAVKMGANVILAVTLGTGRAVGEAYRCEQPKP